MSGRKQTRAPQYSDNRREEAIEANSRRRRKKTRRKSSLFYFLFALSFIVIGLFICANFFFKVEYIRVNGVTRYDPQLVAESTGIAAGDNLFRIDSAAVADKLREEYSYIETVTVRKRYPDTLELNIVQAEPVACFRDELGWYNLINSKGRLLEGNLLTPPENITFVKEFGAAPKPPSNPGREDAEAYELYREEYKLYEEQLAEYKDTLQAFLDILAAIETAGLRNVSHIDLGDRVDIRIICEERITIAIGTESQIEYKLTMVKDAIDTRLERDLHYFIDAKKAGTIRLRPAESDPYDTEQEITDEEPEDPEGEPSENSSEDQPETA